jgi:hypothetical protein
MPESLATQNQAFCETSLETRHLRHTADWTEYTLAQIFDDTLKLFYFTSKDQCNEVLCKFELYDRL